MELKNQQIVIKTQRVHSYRTRHFIGGYAWYHSNQLCIKVPKESFEKTTVSDKSELDFSQCIADTYIHEVGHNLGAKHSHRNTCENYYREWILANISNEKFPVVKKEVKQAVKVDVRYKRYQSALLNFRKAETRFKRAKTLFSKWKSKVLYYETSFAPADKAK